MHRFSKDSQTCVQQIYPETHGKQKNVRKKSVTAQWWVKPPLWRTNVPDVDDVFGVMGLAGSVGVVANVLPASASIRYFHSTFSSKEGRGSSRPWRTRFQKFGLFCWLQPAYQFCCRVLNELHRLADMLCFSWTFFSLKKTQQSPLFIFPLKNLL